MTQFRTIEIDFEVHKKIETERTSFNETPNAVLRRLLKISPNKLPASSAPNTKIPVGKAWMDSGVVLPHGTKLRMRYNGRTSEGNVVDGRWVVNGKEFLAPSPAAAEVAVTKDGKKPQLNGWKQWQVLLPGASTWILLASLKPQKPKVSMTLEELMA